MNHKQYNMWEKGFQKSEIQAIIIKLNIVCGYMGIDENYK